MKQGKRILVVEDESHTREAVRRFLEFRGHHVEVAESGSRAIELAESSPPDVLVCDWKLNDERDGIDVAQHLQARFKIPVIMVTGHRLAQARQKARAKAVNVAAYRRKPVSLNDLAALIESLDRPD